MFLSSVRSRFGFEWTARSVLLWPRAPLLWPRGHKRAPLGPFHILTCSTSSPGGNLGWRICRPPSTSCSSSLPLLRACRALRAEQSAAKAHRLRCQHPPVNPLRACVPIWPPVCNAGAPCCTDALSTASFKAELCTPAFPHAGSVGTPSTFDFLRPSWTTTFLPIATLSRA